MRTNQPWPFHLRWWRDNGVKSVINLRGGGFETSFYVLEREACARLGLTLVDFPVSSREAPSAAQVSRRPRPVRAHALPAVMHCKSGADRAGIMSVLYAHLHLGLPLREALRELSFRHLHVRAGKTGVIDYALDKYLREIEPTGMSFFDWTQSPGYDPAALKAEFRAGWWGTLVTERLLRRE